MHLIAAFIEEGNAASLALFEKLGYAVHQNIYYVSKRDSSDA
jgi:L-amino acid N-acyltransferase YncA